MTDLWQGILHHSPVLILILPLFAAVLCPVLSRIRITLGRRVILGALTLSLVLAICQLGRVLGGAGEIHYWMGDWESIGIEFVIDPVSALMVILVAGVAFLTALYSSAFEKPQPGHAVQGSGYYSILAFLAIGLLGMASTGDAFNLYVFMEITALSGYSLIAMGEGKGPVAAFRYLIIGSMGACSYLVGVGFLYAATGTLNMADLARLMPGVGGSPLVIIAVCCMLVGFGIKMALFPLHGWQPAAHSYAHPAADPMIAGVMIKIPAFAMLRFFFRVFRETSPVMEAFFDILGLLAMLGILFGSLKALRYNTYNKVLAYSSIGQVGYVALGFSLANAYGLAGAVLHILAHSLMKVGLFYTSGAFKYRYGIRNIRDMGQVYRTMPVTALTLTVCALSMIGIPPLAGFFSKWYLLLGAVEERRYLYVAVLLISTLLGAVYFFRVLNSVFMGSSHPKETAPAKERTGRLELPWQMVLPLLAVAVAIVALGLGSGWLVTHILLPTIEEVYLA